MISGFFPGSDEILDVLGVTQCLLVVSSPRFGTTYRSHLQRQISQRRIYSSSTAWSSKMGPICCPETSGVHCKSALSIISEERRSRYRSCVWKHTFPENCDVRSQLICRIQPFSIWELLPFSSWTLPLLKPWTSYICRILVLPFPSLLFELET